MLPIVKAKNKNSKKYTVSFLGLNLSEDYKEGEFSDCQNVSSSLSPCLTQSYAKTTKANYSAADSLHIKDGIIVVDGRDLIHNGAVVGQVSEGRKQICSVGYYVCIFPDKVYYRTDTKEFGTMYLDYYGKAGEAVFTHNTLTIAGADWKFRVGDAVDIIGCTSFPENNKCIIIRGVNGDTLTFYDNSFTVCGELAEDEEKPESYTEVGTVSLRRDIPDMDCICESNYRLWGAKGSTIYGSAYGDPLNFKVFDGLSGDSYNIEVGSDGDFTGAIAFSSHICFFKENTIHKLYGSKPSNYQLISSTVPGVQKGSERSLCVVNETIFYKGVNGVYAYMGGVPELMSECFGNVRFSDACATTDGERYYISMWQGEEQILYVYDVLRGIWLREGETRCIDMAYHDGHVYLLNDTQLLKIDPEASRADMEWSVTFCPFNETMNERKGYSKFHLRMEMEEGAWLTVEVKRDSDRKWKQVYATHNERARTISIPIIPERCDSVEIRLRGKGECLLRTFIREFFTGSDK